MKKLLITLVFFFGFYTKDLLAQQCGFVLLIKGKEIEMTNYDKKGEPDGIVKYKVLESDGTEAKVVSTITNKKGKDLMQSNAIYKCKNGVFSVDMKAMMPQDQMAGMKDMEVKSTEAYLTYPSNLSVGATLPANTFSADIYTGSMKLMTMTIDVSDRKVIGKESVTTSAGTFDCYKITSSESIKAIFKMSFNVTEWFNPSIGVVKTESYRGDKLMGSTAITKISN